jgi:DnaK suppressor protein
MVTDESAAPRRLSARYEELKNMLLRRRLDIVSQVHAKMRDVRTEAAQEKPRAALDAGEGSDTDIQEDIEFTLIQMKSETMSRIDEALSRLEEGEYGNCFECGEEISPLRLKAMPFAVRCRDCEEQYEDASRRERLIARRPLASGQFFDVSH